MKPPTLGDFFLAGRARWRRDGQAGSRRWSSDDFKLEEPDLTFSMAARTFRLKSTQAVRIVKHSSEEANKSHRARLL